jgi:hypothetical protein
MAVTASYWGLLKQPDKQKLAIGGSHYRLVSGGDVEDVIARIPPIIRLIDSREPISSLKLTVTQDVEGAEHDRVGQDLVQVRDALSRGPHREGAWHVSPVNVQRLASRAFAAASMRTVATAFGCESIAR